MPRRPPPSCLRMFAMPAPTNDSMPAAACCCCPGGGEGRRGAGRGNDRAVPARLHHPLPALRRVLRGRRLADRGHDLDDQPEGRSGTGIRVFFAIRDAFYRPVFPAPSCADSAPHVVWCCRATQSSSGKPSRSRHQVLVFLLFSFPSDRCKLAVYEHHPRCRTGLDWCAALPITASAS